MGTLVEEILTRRVGRPVAAGEMLIVDVDFMMSHDNTTPLAIGAFEAIGKPIRHPERVVFHFDHAYPAPNIQAAANQKLIRDFARAQGIRNLFAQGICHQVMFEEGFVAPGRVIMGADSHTNTYGAFGCLAAGFGSSELGVSWVSGRTWLRVPETIRVELTGELPFGVYAKDVMLEVAATLGMGGATYMAVEFGGPFIDALPMPDRIIFANMSTELGAKCGLLAADATTERFLEQHTKAEGPFARLAPVDPDYARVVHLDVSALTPRVACHPRVDTVRPLTELEGMPIDQVFIGTCTNGRFEDMVLAASILRGKQVDPYTRTIVTPASRAVHDRMIREGLVEVFHAAGAVVTGTGCGACIGRHGGVLAPGEKAFTTMNRNFVGRMGSAEAEIYLGSPAAAAATALAGHVADPRPLLAALAAAAAAAAAAPAVLDPEAVR